jgi:hypothetical protein
MLMKCFLKICDELGVPIADEKLVGQVCWSFQRHCQKKCNALYKDQGQ